MVRLANAIRWATGHPVTNVAKTITFYAQIDSRKLRLGETSVRRTGNLSTYKTHRKIHNRRVLSNHIWFYRYSNSRYTRCRAIEFVGNDTSCDDVYEWNSPIDNGFDFFVNVILVFAWVTSDTSIVGAKTKNMDKAIFIQKVFKLSKKPIM